MLLEVLFNLFFSTRIFENLILGKNEEKIHCFIIAMDRACTTAEQVETVSL